MTDLIMSGKVEAYFNDIMSDFKLLKNDRDFSVVMSRNVEAYFDDTLAKFKLLHREVAAELKVRNIRMEYENQLLQAAKDELEAERLELQADRVEFQTEKQELKDSCSVDTKLEFERMQLEAEKSRLKEARELLESEKNQLRVAQAQVKAAQSQLEDAKSQLESAHSQLEEVRAELETAGSHLEAVKAEAVSDSKRLAAAKASLEATKIRFAAATKQLNAAKIRVEATKTLLDAMATDESDRMAHSKDEKAAQLEIKVLELGSEKSKCETRISMLEDDKLSLGAELSQSKAEVESLSVKLKEMVKQLDECCKDKDKSSMADEPAGQPQEEVGELEKQLGQGCDDDTKEKGNPRVFLDIAINGKAAGRIVIELDVKTTPITSENFRALCTGEKGIGQSGKPLHYKGTKFNHIDAINYYCSGGDNVNEDGLFGESIYGPTFGPENFIRKHTGSGLVSMANNPGYPRSRGSQFFITTTKIEDFDGRCVVFGDVVEGMNVVKEIMKTKPGASVIVNCGQLY